MKGCTSVGEYDENAASIGIVKVDTLMMDEAGSSKKLVST
jgi:hypothetical protein